MEPRVLYRDMPALPFAAALALVSLAFLTIRYWLGNHDSWLSLSIFATVLALGLLLGVWRRKRASEPLAVLDSSGLTLWLRRGLKLRASSVTLPWSNVAGASVRTIPGSRIVVYLVVVAIRDLEEFVSTIPPDRRDAARRAAERYGGPIHIPKTRDLTTNQLIELIDGFRNASSASRGTLSSDRRL
jgi:hypothetical protein